ncbi:MAG: response regulator transcription factor [Clostridiales bacterium]|jgi:DNA-binding response OmpR family regulator|nr:response regulator transcription factor [Clostridiales bacterium]
MGDRILVVEDEEKLSRFIELELSYEGYEVEKAGDGRSGLAMAEAKPFDLILLDIMLPELNGLEVLRRLRRFAETPVILLTARDSVMDKVTGLDSGADDYITKPFAIEELLARIRTALRKKKAEGSGGATPGVLHMGRLTLDVPRYSATMDQTPVELTKREFDLLKILMENAGIVLTRDILLERVWGYNYLGETNSVDVYIRFLRGKIDDAFGVKYIHTVRGVGYTMRVEEEAR